MNELLKRHFSFSPETFDEIKAKGGGVGGGALLVILMSFYLLFIGSDDTALLLICHHDMNVFCNRLLLRLNFIKKLSLNVSLERQQKREKAS